MICVIGNKGMLGTQVCQTLAENNLEYTGTDREVDICDFSSLKNFAEGKNISWIINCAAFTDVNAAESNEELADRLNANAPGNIAQLAKDIGAKLIHISTDYVFDGNGSKPYKENDPTNAPLGVYGKTKLAGENAVIKNTDAYYIIRTAWLYGWAGKNFVYTMIRAMNKNESVKVVDDQKGSPTFAFDLAMCILKIIEKSDVPYGIYHFSNMGEITWYDFTLEIKNLAEKAGLIKNTACKVFPCKTKDFPTPAKRPAYSVLCKDKITKATGIIIPDWKKSLNEFILSEKFDLSRIE